MQRQRAKQSGMNGEVIEVTIRERSGGGGARRDKGNKRSVRMVKQRK